MSQSSLSEIYRELEAPRHQKEFTGREETRNLEDYRHVSVTWASAVHVYVAYQWENVSAAEEYGGTTLSP
jgi:hypothetical protein